VVPESPDPDPNLNRTPNPNGEDPGPGPRPASWSAFAFLAACAIVPGTGRNRSVFIDSQPESSAVASRLEQRLSLDGYRIVRGREQADFVLRLAQESAIDKQLAPAAGSAFTLTAPDGRRFTSLDAQCRGYAGTPAECHAERLVRDLQDAGELKSPAAR